MASTKPLTGAERVARRREALRARGLRPRTFWLPDTQSPEFRERAALACAAIDRAWEDQELRGWMDAMVDAVLADLPPPDGLV